MKDELYHHGILGMKWGIRRYKASDGTYTKAGLKRFNESMSTYESKRKAYKEAKASKSKTKGELTNMKLGVKQAKNKLVKDYKHLKLDKLGDKGKERYARGETITNNNSTTFAILKGSSLVAAGSYYLHNAGILDSKTTRNLMIGSAVATGAAYAKQFLVDEPRNRQLRAYYSHTSNY